MNTFPGLDPRQAYAISVAQTKTFLAYHALAMHVVNRVCLLRTGDVVRLLHEDAVLHCDRVLPRL